jgi:hypothetical protein
MSVETLNQFSTHQDAGRNIWVLQLQTAKFAKEQGKVVIELGTAQHASVLQLCKINHSVTI